jgi:hypothetical protein
MTIYNDENSVTMDIMHNIYNLRDTQVVICSNLITKIETKQFAKYKPLPQSTDSKDRRHHHDRMVVGFITKS